MLKLTSNQAGIFLKCLRMFSLAEKRKGNNGF